MQTIVHQTDFCIVGGGLSGLSAAVSAARHGIKVVLMQDRPVLGGNSSSEIRMWVCGAHGQNNRETGIIEEAMLENYYRNPELSFSIWDSVLYEKAILEPNITLLLNCSCLDATMENTSIKSIKGWQTTTQTYHEVCATYFCDSSGDSILAPLTSAHYMLGREARDEFNESIAPIVADRKTMGMSCLFQVRQTNSPQKFIPPAWAYKYETDDCLPYREHDLITNYWWIELGGDVDSIGDTEKMRHELLKIAFGVWDHMKNHGEHGAENWQLDWIGFLPGKRESRRYIGKYIVNQNDVETCGKFEDVVAYGGWTMDDHTPEGFNCKGCPNIFHPAPSPWGIPFRSLYSNNIDNLFFAGRNISVTHAALSSSRVMATCALLGQAVGTGVAIAVSEKLSIIQIPIDKLQQTLLYDDVYLPYVERELSNITNLAKTNYSVLKNGKDRPDNDNYNGYIGEINEKITFEFDTEQKISQIRLIFDSDLNRQYKNMPCNFPLVQNDYKTPKTLVKSYKIMIETNTEETMIIENENNYQRMVKHDICVNAKSITIVPTATWGDVKVRIFSVDIL